jgi:hypothetical protein
MGPVKPRQGALWGPGVSPPTPEQSLSLRRVEGMSIGIIRSEVQRGGRFVRFDYVVSALLLTFRQESDPHLIRSGERALAVGARFTVVTLLLGWWGIPWGPLFSVRALWRNLRGGIDVTADVMAVLDDVDRLATS